MTESVAKRAQNDRAPSVALAQGGDLGIDGLSAEAKETLLAQRRLLVVAQSTTDAVLQAYLVSAASSTSHRGASPSYEPSYYAVSLAEYRSYEKERLEPIQSEEESIRRQLNVTTDAGVAQRLIARLLQLEGVDEPEVIEHLNRIHDRMIPSAQPHPENTYIPFFADTTMPVPGESVGFSVLTVVNRTGREIIVDLDGASAPLKNCEKFTRELAAGDHPISAMIATDTGQETVIQGRSFLKAADGDSYAVAVALAAGAAGRQTADQEVASLGASSPCSDRRSPQTVSLAPVKLSTTGRLLVVGKDSTPSNTSFSVAKPENVRDAVSGSIYGNPLDLYAGKYWLEVSCVDKQITVRPGENTNVQLGILLLPDAVNASRNGQKLCLSGCFEYHVHAPDDKKCDFYDQESRYSEHGSYDVGNQGDLGPREIQLFPGTYIVKKLAIHWGGTGRYTVAVGDKAFEVAPGQTTVVEF